LYFEPKALLLGSSPDDQPQYCHKQRGDDLPALGETTAFHEDPDYYGEINNTTNNLTSYTHNNTTRHISISDTLFSSVTNQTAMTKPPTPPHHGRNVPQPPPMPPPTLNESSESTSSSSASASSSASSTSVSNESGDHQQQTQLAVIPSRSSTAIPLATQEETVEEEDNEEVVLDDKEDRYHYQYDYNYNGNKHGSGAGNEKRHPPLPPQPRQMSGVGQKKRLGGNGGKMTSSSSDLGRYYQHQQPVHQLRKQTSSTSGRIFQTK
jgi:hypothetical protein